MPHDHSKPDCCDTPTKHSFEQLAYAIFSLSRELNRVCGQLEEVNHSALLKRFAELERKIMTALESLTQTVTDSTTAQTELIAVVNEAIIHIGQPGATDAQLNTLAAAIAANTASDQALVASLKAALNPVPPVEPPTPE